MPTISTEARFDRATYDYPAAAEYLGIKPRTLWNLAAPRGPIATISIGRRVLFSRESLDSFLSSCAVDTVNKEAVHDE